MKKKLGIMALCLGLIIAVLVAIGVFVITVEGPKGDPDCRFYFTDIVDVKDGSLVLNEEVGANSNAIPFSVGYDVKYRLHVVWDSNHAQVPFVTALVIRDSAGKVMNYVTGDIVDAYLDLDDMTVGDYTAEYTYFIREEEFKAFLNGLGANDVNDIHMDYNADGKWAMAHSFELEEHSTSYRVGYLVGAVGGAFLGVIGTILLLLATKKNDTIKAEYDERQELIRGKGFKYAFFTMLVYYGLMAIIDLAEIPLPMESGVTNFLGALLGVVLFASYGIWKDAYFSINERKGMLMVIFALLALIETLAGIGNLKSGAAIVGGVITLHMLPLVCGIIFIALLVQIIIKSMLDREDE